MKTGKEIFTEIKCFEQRIKDLNASINVLFTPTNNEINWVIETFIKDLDDKIKIKSELQKNCKKPREILIEIGNSLIDECTKLLECKYETIK